MKKYKVAIMLFIFALLMSACYPKEYKSDFTYDMESQCVVSQSDQVAFCGTTQEIEDKMSFAYDMPVDQVRMALEPVYARATQDHELSKAKQEYRLTYQYETY